MNLAPESIGLIAGSRSLPLDFARLARAAGVRRIVCTAVEGETDPALAALVDDIVWLNVGQLGKMISAFTSRGVKQVVMAGQVAPKNLFDLRPDLRALGVLDAAEGKKRPLDFWRDCDRVAKGRRGTH
jgi:DUF1009 family protein